MCSGENSDLPVSFSDYDSAFGVFPACSMIDRIVDESFRTLSDGVIRVVDESFGALSNGVINEVVAEVIDGFVDELFGKLI